MSLHHEQYEDLTAICCPDCYSPITPRNRGEDGRCISCTDPEGVKRLQELAGWRARAVNGADLIIRVLGRNTQAWWLYTPEDLAKHARVVYRSCVKFQMLGGRA
jgi:hypothetical protein